MMNGEFHNRAERKNSGEAGICIVLDVPAIVSQEHRHCRRKHTLSPY